MTADRTLFFLQVVDHVLNHFGWILVNDPDHHPAQDGIDIPVDILQLFTVLILQCLLGRSDEALEFDLIALRWQLALTPFHPIPANYQTNILNLKATQKYIRPRH